MSAPCVATQQMSFATSFQKKSTLFLVCAKSVKTKCLAMLKHFVLVIPCDVWAGEISLVKYLKENCKQIFVLEALATKEGYDSLAEFLHDGSVVPCWDVGDVMVLFWPEPYGLSLTQDGLFFYDEW